MNESHFPAAQLCRARSRSSDSLRSGYSEKVPRNWVLGKSTQKLGTRKKYPEKVPRNGNKGLLNNPPWKGWGFVAGVLRGIFPNHDDNMQMSKVPSFWVFS